MHFKVVLLLAQFVRLYTSRLYSYIARNVTIQMVGSHFEVLGLFETLISNMSIFLCISLLYGAATASF